MEQEVELLLAFRNWLANQVEIGGQAKPGDMGFGMGQADLQVFWRGRAYGLRIKDEGEEKEWRGE